MVTPPAAGKVQGSPGLAVTVSAAAFRGAAGQARARAGRHPRVPGHHLGRHEGPSPGCVPLRTGAEAAWWRRSGGEREGARPHPGCGIQRDSKEVPKLCLRTASLERWV